MGWSQAPGSGRRLPLWLKLGWTAWVLAWFPLYMRQYGPQNFLWFCDIANILIGVALWIESPLIVSWQAVSILLVQIAFTLDLLTRLVAGFHPIHATEYMFDAHMPLGIRLLSLFHVATPPLLIWLLRRLGYDRRGLVAQVATAAIILPVCYFLVPAHFDVNWIWGPADKIQTSISSHIYFALCMVAYPLLLYLPSHLALRAIFPPRADA